MNHIGFISVRFIWSWLLSQAHTHRSLGNTIFKFDAYSLPMAHSVSIAHRQPHSDPLPAQYEKQSSHGQTMWTLYRVCTTSVKVPLTGKSWPDVAFRMATQIARLKLWTSKMKSPKSHPAIRVIKNDSASFLFNYASEMVEKSQPLRFPFDPARNNDDLIKKDGLPSGTVTKQ